MEERKNMRQTSTGPKKKMRTGHFFKMGVLQVAYCEKSKDARRLWLVMTFTHSVNNGVG